MTVRFDRFCRTMGRTKVFYEYLNQNDYYRIGTGRHSACCSAYIPRMVYRYCSPPNNSAYYLFCFVKACDVPAYNTIYYTAIMKITNWKKRTNEKLFIANKMILL